MTEKKRNNTESKKKYPMEILTQNAIDIMRERGVRLEDIADIVYKMQSPFSSNLSIDDCIYAVKRVFEKREVVYAVLTGIQIDKLTEEGKIEEPLASIIKSDEGLYGIDEILPLSIINLYGSIGLTTFGYLDKEKIGIIKKLDSKSGNVNTFLDDLVAAIAAAAASRIAHSDE